MGVLLLIGTMQCLVSSPPQRVPNAASTSFTYARAATVAKCTSPLFQSEIMRQLQAGDDLVRGINPPRGGICISIRNNSVARVVRGNGSVHQWRAKQHTSFFRNLAAKRLLPDSDININLSDFPLGGFFNFCRDPGWGGKFQFVLPNHRFTLDDVFLSMSAARGSPLPSYDEELTALKKMDREFESKAQRAYLSVTPHRSKWKLLRAAVDAPEALHVWAFIGPPHGDLRLPVKLKERLLELGMAGMHKRPFDDHFGYKYLISPRGNTASDRLRLLLPLNAVVLRDVSEKGFVDYREFYYDLLKPWKHYVPVTASTINATITKLNTSPRLCRHIIAAQHEFVRQFLGYARIQDYVQSLLWVLFPPSPADADAARRFCEQLGMGVGESVAGGARGG